MLRGVFVFRRAATAIAAATLAITLLGFAVQSASIPEAIAWKVTEAIVIDGNLDEWNLSSPIVIEREGQLIKRAESGVGIWSGPTDLSAKVYLMWDESNLYVAAEVIDDTPFMYREGFPLDEADSMILYFSTNPSADPGRGAYESTDFRVVFLIDNCYFDTGIDRSMVDDKRGIETQGMQGYEQVLDGYECAVGGLEGGYTFEAKIPWSNFSSPEIPLFVPAKGMTIGFDVELSDLDATCPGASTCSMAWVGDSTIITNPSKWGTLTFESA